MGALALPDIDAVEDYLRWVWEQPYKYETIEGRIVMMAGGSASHARIAVNVTTALATRLAGTRCLTYNSDFLIQAHGRNRYFPDASVACDETRDFTDRPTMVVEVLSPSTMNEDLGPKLANYLRTPGLRYILYLWQDQVRARLWLPDRPNEAPRELTLLGEAIALPSLGIELPMAELFRDVRLG